MQKLTVKITVPNKGGQWKITIGSGQKKKKNAVETFRSVERFLNGKSSTYLATDSSKKIVLIVDYSAISNQQGNSLINNGSYAHKKDILYALACFLEDYLPERYIKQKNRLYR